VKLLAMKGGAACPTFLIGPAFPWADWPRGRSQPPGASEGRPTSRGSPRLSPGSRSLARGHP